MTDLGVTDLVRLDRVSRRFRTQAEVVVAVDDVSLWVRPGEIVALVGPSGSGKSTTLNLVLGWESPDAGTVERSIERTGWAGVAVVPQELGLLPELTARENVELPVRIIGGSHESADELLDALGLDGLAERFPSELSHGEQQRVAVARAMIARPELVVADEPTAHQDEARADAVMHQLVRVAAGGGGVLVATHDLRLLEGVDRVAYLLDGRITVGQASGGSR